MQSSNDEEIVRIKQKKLQQMMEQKPSTIRGNEFGKAIALSDQTFEEAVSKEPVMVVDFWAEWCGPCRMVAPVIEQLAHDYAGKVAFGKLNVDDNPAISSAFQVQSIPTILIFKSGKLVDGVVGAVPKQYLESRIKPHLNN